MTGHCEKELAKAAAFILCVCVCLACMSCLVCLGRRGPGGANADVSTCGSAGRLAPDHEERKCPSLPSITLTRSRRRRRCLGYCALRCGHRAR
eukprot:5379285-Alexandrium_andersonii.AAC.1